MLDYVHACPSCIAWELKHPAMEELAALLIRGGGVSRGAEALWRHACFRADTIPENVHPTRRKHRNACAVTPETGKRLAYECLAEYVGWLASRLRGRRSTPYNV